MPTDDPAPEEPASPQADVAAPRPVTDAAAGDVAPGSDAADDEVRADAADDDSPAEAPDVSACVLDALLEGPATSFEIADRVRDRCGEDLHRREGHLVPLLLQLRRDGAVDARWEDRDDGRRRVYSLPGAPPAPAPDAAPPGPDAPVPDAPPPPPTTRRPPSATLHRYAADATRRLEFAPRLAEEVRAEIVAHLEDLVANEQASAGSPDPEKAALRRFGDPWKISTDLARVARGRRTVLFPRSIADSLQSLGIYESGILLAIVAVIVFVRVQVVAAYHIPTKSMEPTLHGEREGGDRILVFRLAPRPERFDIVVFEGWGDDRRQYVKRCVGLPGEHVRMREGDLWVDGHLVRKEGAVMDALLFPLFDLATTAKAAGAGGRRLPERVRDGWTFDGGRKWAQWPDGTFEVEAEAGVDPAVLRWDAPLDDAFLDPEDGACRGGIVGVADGRLTADVTRLDEKARVALRWIRGDSTFEAVLADGAPGVALTADGQEIARNAGVSLAVGRPARVRLSHVDHVLRLDVDGETVLRHEFPEPDSPRSSAPGAAVSVRILDGKARILPVRLERDVHWTAEYDSLDHGALRDDEYFMLGDNSSNSQDSRARGPVHEGRLLGKPLLVVWPLSRIRVPR